MTVHEFDWYAARLDLARWESQEKGSRSGFFSCPVHGGSDSLHVTEKNGKALLNCFACGASASAITGAVEDEGAAEEEEATPSDLKPITVTRSRGARGRQQDGPGGRGAARGVRLPAASTTPMAWMAARCGVSLEDLKKFPLHEDGNELVFEFEGVDAEKRRGVGEGKGGKKYRWTGSAAPPLWPMPDVPSREIVVCEGEADAICLQRSGYEAYSITKGSSGEVPATAWEALSEQGVETAWVVFDADDAGRKGRALAVEGARAAGLTIKEGRVAGIRPLEGETDARDVALRQGYPLVIEHDVVEDAPVLLSDIEVIVPEPLIFGRLHPQEHTILYGDGGTGKGVIAASWVAQLTRLGMRVLVVDYEYHANFEWVPRVIAFGGDAKMVSIVQPKKPIWDIVGWLHDWAADYEYVVVDSVSYAVFGDDVEKSATAVRYSMAINQLGKPVLSLGHVTKADADPNHPFGSVFWSNGARVTMALSRKPGEGSDGDRILRNPKSNQQDEFAPVGIDWSWLGQSGPPGCADRGKDHEPWNHLHEKVVVRSFSAALDAAYVSLFEELKAEPPSDVVFARIDQDNPGMKIPSSSPQQLSKTRAKYRPVRVNRVAPGE